MCPIWDCLHVACRSAEVKKMTKKNLIKSNRKSTQNFSRECHLARILQKNHRAWKKSTEVKSRQKAATVGEASLHLAEPCTYSAPIDFSSTTNWTIFHIILPLHHLPFHLFPHSAEPAALHVTSKKHKHTGKCMCTTKHNKCIPGTINRILFQYQDLMVPWDDLTHLYIHVKTVRSVFISSLKL